MKQVLKIGLLLLVTALSGCATEAKYKQMLNAWQGRNINDLISAWGYPDKTMTAPDGNQVYVYQRQTIQSFPVYSIPSYTTVTTQNNQTIVVQSPSIQSGGGTYYFNCTAWIEFDKKDIIVRTLYRGNDCVAN